MCKVSGKIPKGGQVPPICSLLARRKDFNIFTVDLGNPVRKKKKKEREKDGKGRPAEHTTIIIEPV